MLPVILTILLIILFIFSIIILVMKRRKGEITGMKSALTPMFLYLIAVNNILAYWLDLLGIVSWSISVLLLFLAAYFTKYFPEVKNDY